MLSSTTADLRRPEQKFRETSILILRYIKEKVLPVEVGKRLIKAVQEFGNYMHPEPDPHEITVGDCLTWPNDFSHFCREQHGLNVTEVNSYESLSLAELALTGEAYPLQSAHYLNVLGNVAIDWTARQFDSTLPFPWIFRVDEFMKRFGRPLYDSLAFKRNARYTPAPNDTLLIKN